MPTEYILGETWVNEEAAGKLGIIAIFATLRAARARRDEIIMARAAKNAPFGPIPPDVTAARLSIWRRVI